jgi:hypothetical protein
MVTAAAKWLLQEAVAGAPDDCVPAAQPEVMLAFHIISVENKATAIGDIALGRVVVGQKLERGILVQHMLPVRREIAAADDLIGRAELTFRATIDIAWS